MSARGARAHSTRARRYQCHQTSRNHGMAKRTEGMRAGGGMRIRIRSDFSEITAASRYYRGARSSAAPETRANWLLNYHESLLLLSLFLSRFNSGLEEGARPSLYWRLYRIKRYDTMVDSCVMCGIFINFRNYFVVTSSFPEHTAKTMTTTVQDFNIIKHSG